MTVVAVVQSSAEASKEANVERAAAKIADAAKGGAQVVCLQELFATHYPCQSEDHARFADAEPMDGPTVARLSKVAKEHGVVVVAPVFERRAPGIYHNSAAVIDADGSCAGVYRKMHIPDDPLYYEKFYFTPGDLGFRSFDTRHGRVGVCICWDQWFPEAARLTAMTGANILFYPTAIGWLPDERDTLGESQRQAWETMMRSHAIANGVFVAAPNRVGREGEVQFWGSSFVADPYGNILGRASQQQEETLIVECDFDVIDTARTHWPFFRDRRVDAYTKLASRWTDSAAP